MLTGADADKLLEKHKDTLPAVTVVSYDLLSGARAAGVSSKLRTKNYSKVGTKLAGRIPTTCHPAHVHQVASCFFTTETVPNLLLTQYLMYY